MRRKPSKRKKDKCFICDGRGRLDIRKESGIPKEYIHLDERCQLCNGTGEMNYESC